MFGGVGGEPLICPTVTPSPSGSSVCEINVFCLGITSSFIFFVGEGGERLVVLQDVCMNWGCDYWIVN